MENTNPTPEKKTGGKWKIIVGVLVVVVIVGAVVLGAQGGLFQGKIFRFNAPATFEVEKAVTVKDVTIETPEAPADEPEDEPEDEPTEPAVNGGHLIVSLSSSSPSGSRTISINDTIASFELCAVGGHVTVNNMEFLLTGNRDMMQLGQKYPFKMLNTWYDAGNNIIGSPSVPSGSTTDATINALTDSVNFAPDYMHFSIAEGACNKIDLVTDTTELIQMTVNDENLSVSLENVTVDEPAVVDTTFPVAGNTLRY